MTKTLPIEKMVFCPQNQRYQNEIACNVCESDGGIVYLEIGVCRQCLWDEKP